jgi:hypothetical protein
MWSNLVLVLFCVLPAAVAALTNLYLDLQQPAQLWNWKINATAGAGAGMEDPCAQNWLGVVCSGANVTEL